MLVKKLVQKGTSAYVLIPADFLKMLDLKLGDSVKLEIQEKKIIIEKNWD